MAKVTQLFEKPDLPILRCKWCMLPYCWTYFQCKNISEILKAKPTRIEPVLISFFMFLY